MSQNFSKSCHAPSSFSWILSPEFPAWSPSGKLPTLTTGQLPGHWGFKFPLLHLHVSKSIFLPWGHFFNGFLSFSISTLIIWSDITFLLDYSDPVFTTFQSISNVPDSEMPSYLHLSQPGTYSHLWGGDDVGCVWCREYSHNLTQMFFSQPTVQILRQGSFSHSTVKIIAVSLCACADGLGPLPYAINGLKEDPQIANHACQYSFWHSIGIK